MAKSKTNPKLPMILLIVALVMISIVSLTVINNPQSIAGLDSAKVSYAVNIDQVCPVNEELVSEGFTPKEAGFLECTYSTDDTPLKSGEWALEISEVGAGAEFVCTMQNQKICLQNGVRTNLRPHIDAIYTTSGSPNPHADSVIGQIQVFFDSENSFDIDYNGRTGLRINEEFEAPVKVDSNLDVAVDVGVVAKSKTLILEQEGEELFTQTELLSTSKTYDVPVNTESFGINEFELSPYVKFEKVGAFEKFVGSEKKLFVGFRVSPQVEGQPLPEGTIGFKDPDTGISRITTGVVDSVEDATEDKNQRIFLIIVGLIVLVLIVRMFVNKDK